MGAMVYSLSDQGCSDILLPAIEIGLLESFPSRNL